MTAEHEGAEGAREYAGMDALMAAITGDPLPEEARRDPAFRAEHRAAEADVSVLREQLALLAGALTGEEPGERPAPDAGRTPAPRQPADGDTTAPAVDAPAEETAGPAAPARPGRRPRGATRPAAPARPARPPRPGRPHGSRRALRIALGSLAGAAALGMVAGLGWLVAQPAGTAGDAKSSAADGAKSAGRAPATISGDGGRPDAPAQALACYELVVEGTVAAVEPRSGSPWTRIELTVRRAYEPAHTPARVAFDLDAGARPAPRVGRHVLVGIERGRTDASLWAVGDTRVAVNRAWITEALPEARHTACPSASRTPTGEP
ncbi:hypothetical protein [Streptomyces sp. IBSBF 3136]|uniref:hypothetical protein n=1 Tax=Streptomyces sp. IBSBF 3136 TaxID=2903524 RepID=UPI002FDC7A1E